MAREPQQGGNDSKAAPIRLLLQGGPGTGKTIAALSFPKPLFFDFNTRIQRYAKHYKDLRFFTDYQELDRQRPPLGFKRFYEEDLQRQYADVETLVIDSFAEMQATIMEWVVHTRLGTKATGANLNRREQQDYGWVYQYSEHILKLLMATGKHIVVIAHEDLRESDTPNLDGATLKKVLPTTMGSIRSDLAKFFDFYFGTFAEADSKTNKGKYSLVTAPRWGRDFKVTLLQRELFEPIIDVTGKSVYEEITKRLAQGGLGSQAGGQPSTPTTK